MIKKAHSKDAKALTELTLRSKAYWGYTKEQILAWKDELTITAAYINNNQVFTLTISNNLVGFYAFQPITNEVVKLNFFFIDPAYIKKGFGKELMHDFINRIENSNFTKVTLDADPNAESFYTKFGFRVVGQLKSTIKNRFLPIMTKEII